MSRKNLIILYIVLICVWIGVFIQSIILEDYVITFISVAVIIKNGYMIYRHNKNDKEIEEIIRTV